MQNPNRQAERSLDGEGHEEMYLERKAAQADQGRRFRRFFSLLEPPFPINLLQLIDPLPSRDTYERKLFNLLLAIILSSRSNLCTF